MNNDPILKDKLNVYNNLATSGDSSGRLSIIYNIYPAPTIFWEFETASKDSPEPKYDENGKISPPFEDIFLSVPEAWPGSSNELSIYKPIGSWVSGRTPKVIIGDQNLVGKSFSFYLPNAAFQKVGTSGKNFRVKEISHYNSQASRKVDRNFREGFAEANIGNKNTLSMYTPIESINWLKGSRSVGTYITTSGNLLVDKDISIDAAVHLLKDITFLLSFANGGFIAPLVVSMSQQDREKEYPSIYSAYIIDPVEHIMSTWFSPNSDIVMLLECFPAFQKMLETEPWKSNFHWVLTWYFQAFQPPGIQHTGKRWPVAANALGAALEKLASIILVEEMKVVTEDDFRSKKNIWFLESKIRKLLEVIGVTEIIEYDTQDPEHGVKDAVWWFKEMRNDATHPKSNHSWDDKEEVSVICGNAIQWVEEILLWRLGYQGRYWDRSSGRIGTLPRYKVELRIPSW